MARERLVRAVVAREDVRGQMVAERRVVLTLEETEVTEVLLAFGHGRSNVVRQHGAVIHEATHDAVRVGLARRAVRQHRQLADVDGGRPARNVDSRLPRRQSHRGGVHDTEVVRRVWCTDDRRLGYE